MIHVELHIKTYLDILKDKDRYYQKRYKYSKPDKQKIDFLLP